MKKYDDILQTIIDKSLKENHLGDVRRVETLYTSPEDQKRIQACVDTFLRKRREKIERSNKIEQELLDWEEAQELDPDTGKNIIAFPI